ncbi:MAG: M20/M25/M40 family metallo-hydrolase [Candidatus Eisenbacteria bacterium]
MKRRVSLILLALALLPAIASAEKSLWVAPLDRGSAIQDAWDAGAEVLDHSEDVLIVGDEPSASALRRAGFRVEGPLAVPAGREISLLRLVREETGTEIFLLAELLRSTPGGETLWSDGVNFLVASEGPLPESELLAGFDRRPLRDRPVRRPIAGAPPGFDPGRTTVFPAIIDGMIAQIDSASYMQWIGNLAGANGITVSGFPDTIFSRHSSHADCDTAERYVYERFLDMGFTDVAFDTCSFFEITGRNVVATLPGIETPDRIYILCGHLDATGLNPTINAPGANDNASGVSVVLTSADILKDYRFRSTIRFIAFTGEEQGLQGSRHYAHEAALRGDSILGVVNCDMVAWYETEYRVDIRGGAPWTWLMQIVGDACAEYTGLETQLLYSGGGSDHVSFQQEGYAAVCAIESEASLYPCYHKSCDKTDRNDGVFGSDVTRACLAAIAHMAGPLAETGLAGAESPPLRLALRANRPNPFNPSTAIRFTLPRTSTVLLAVHDAAGRIVRVLENGALEAGEHERVWDGTSNAGLPAGSGVYFYRLTTGEGSRAGKMLLAR